MFLGMKAALTHCGARFIQEHKYDMPLTNFLHVMILFSLDQSKLLLTVPNLLAGVSTLLVVGSCLFLLAGLTLVTSDDPCSPSFVSIIWPPLPSITGAFFLGWLVATGFQRVISVEMWSTMDVIFAALFALLLTLLAVFWAMEVWDWVS